MVTTDSRLTSDSTARAIARDPGSCCGGPPPTGAAACCAKDAEVKASGGNGCGCNAQGSVLAEPVPRRIGVLLLTSG
jgi:hypothetical protein